MGVGIPWGRSILLAGSAGIEAVLQLVLPPLCRLCDLPVGESDDFCRRCETALTLSEPMMQAACTRCGIPRPRAASRLAPTRADEEKSRADEEKSRADEEKSRADEEKSSADEEKSRADEEKFCAAGEKSNSVPRQANSDEHRGSIEFQPMFFEPCIHCLGSSFQFDGVATLWSYQARVCDAVVAAKYAHQTPLGDALGRRLGSRVKAIFAGDLPDFVTFVPSHMTRQFTRGGNGNLAIANAVARSIERPCRLLMRTTRRISKQAWLEDTQRLENVRGAFSLKKSYALLRSPRIATRHILVVDDVLTTGATANEVARVLRDDGARRVSLAVVARAVRSQ